VKAQNGLVNQMWLRGLNPVQLKSRIPVAGLLAGLAAHGIG
jgi:hypothetical protein